MAVDKIETRQRRVLVAAAVAVLAALAVALGWFLARSTLPADIAGPAPVKYADVSVSAYVDSRTVDLAATLEPSAGLIAQAGGLLTASRCEPAETISSGSSTFTLDGEPLVNLGTSQPLWRTLTVGTQGDDVRALQESFVALGFTGSVDGVLGTRTIDFFNSLRRRALATASTVDAISPGAVVWLNAATVAVASCELPVGSAVQPGDVLASLPPRISALRIGTMPVVLPTEARTLVIDSVSADVDAEGAVASDIWSAIAATPSFTSYVADPKNVAFTGTLQLRHPVDVGRVPPSAVFGITGSSGCVTDGESTFHGSIVSAELGYTLMQFDDSAPAHVELSPRAVNDCS